MNTNKIDFLLRVMSFANAAHKDQKRKGNKMPYIVHPFSVGMILKEQGVNDEAVAAGFLHDTVEDTKVTIEEIEKLFGKQVAFYVQWVTEPEKDKSWEERKQYTIEKLKNAPLEVKLIKSADKYHNLFTIKEDLKIKGEKVWDAFTRNKSKQKWYSEEAYKSILENVENPDKYPIFKQLKDLIDELFGK